MFEAKKYYFPFLIGQCCVDQVLTPVTDPSDISGLNEIVYFTNQTTLTVAWNAARILRFGDAGVIQVEIQGLDGKYRITAVEVVPDAIVGTTYYTIDLGGISSGRYIIT